MVRHEAFDSSTPIILLCLVARGWVKSFSRQTASLPVSCLKFIRGKRRATIETTWSPSNTAHALLVFLPFCYTRSLIVNGAQRSVLKAEHTVAVVL